MTANEEQRLDAFRTAITVAKDLDADECRRLLDAYAGPAGWDRVVEFNVEHLVIVCNVRVLLAGRWVTRGVATLKDVAAGLSPDWPFVAAVKQFGYAPDVIDESEVQPTPPAEATIPDPSPEPTPALPRKWQCPPAGRLWQWLKAREDETTISIVAPIRRFAQKTGYPDRFEEWDEPQTVAAHRLAIQLFRQNRVPIEPESTTPEPVSTLKSVGKGRVLHINEPVAWLDDETGEEMQGIVADQKHEEDGRVTAYQVKRTDKSKVWVDAKLAWSTHEEDL